jgi:DNA processing protein
VITGHDLLVLSRIPGVGPARLRALVTHFGDAPSIFHASPGQLIAVEGIERKTAITIANFFRHGIPADSLKYAAGQISRLAGAGGRLISFWDDDYPPHLKRIYDPPPFLFVRGSLTEADTPSIAVVGTRTPTPYGARVAERFAADLCSLGITVVSGLARGIDTIAHGAALRAGGRTLAVIGSGIDVLYPPENSGLASRLAERGALLSEFVMGTKPDAVNFPQRNRIISGITLGTLVVETGTEGGAMITARLALDQGREVFAVPSPVTAAVRSGTNMLIREGNALLTESVEDIMTELGSNLRRAGIVPPVRSERSLPPLTLFEQKIFDALTEHPVHIDTIARLSGYSTSEALVHLLALEFKGAIRQLPGKLFLRV